MTIVEHEKAEVREELDPRVVRGAAFLDEHVDGWYMQIDVDKLELQHCNACVIGQLFGRHVLSYEKGCTSLGLNAWEGRIFKLGFHSDEGEGDWEKLNESWRRLIRARQQERVSA